ncbi:E3 ubiquitin-protein ligase ATL42-like isoform X1 [Syzygium oleosum]|uniref:E3 ubiquitin-protein ligase ATL42-like isoform X1 n=1 Tax=Syzygium oleosum TaxID=219896 RepID=UPI0011D19B6A|nr:E3 ubiquitin-protein ligase ATL42-like isoform X1 [Syzygium oleosum]
MNQVHVLVWVSLLDLLFLQVQGQTSYGQDSLSSSSQDTVSNFQPSLAVVIGILSVMFSVTFVLLVYAKFCHRAGPTTAGGGDQENPAALARSRSRFSGIDKTVIESLPFFRFSSLKGSKKGLECAVCLSKFEDIEILRLLPKCRHAFHIDCIDYWLEKHSSCPLCRHKVSDEDLANFTYSNSMRLMSQSDMRQDSNLELFVQREVEFQGSSSRFSIGSSFRKIFKSNKEEEIQEEAENRKILHKLNHKIIASDVILKNRWSNVSSSDLMLLNSEMLSDLSSNRFSSLELKGAGQAATMPVRTFESGEIMKIKEEMDRKRLFESKLSSIDKNSLVSDSAHPSTSPVDSGAGQQSKIMSPADKRSMSEITGMSRFGDSSTRNRHREMSALEGGDFKDERMRQIWLPIARRTVQWFANRETRSQDTLEPTHTTLPDV